MASKLNSLQATSTTSGQCSAKASTRALTSLLLSAGLRSLTSFIEKRLKLKVNAHKLGIAPATKRGMLGFRFLKRKGRVDIRIEPKARKAMANRIRQLNAPGESR